VGYLRGWGTAVVLLGSCMVLLTGCSGEGTDPGGIDRVASPAMMDTLRVESDGLDTKVEIGIWMFKDRTLSRDAVADWLGRPHRGLELFEPINVVWIDIASGSSEEAAADVAQFLTACGFSLSRLHTSGYSAVYADTTWIGQDPRDQSWEDEPYPRDSNHGRVFPAYEHADGLSRGVYVTSGAFSKESGVVHNHVSFNAGRDALRTSTGWSELEIVNLANEYPVQDVASSNGAPDGAQAARFSTSDHDGVRVFLREAEGK